MTDIFIINPSAGKKKNIESLSEKIKSDAKALERNIEIHITEKPGDAEEFVRKRASQKERIRFYSCGGDGTFNEVVNGCFGFENASAGIMAMGSGNDFCRNFDGDFLSPGALLNGREELIDLIKYSGVINGKYSERYCANMFNIGFDANVCDLSVRMKKYPFVSGFFSYYFSVFALLLTKKGANLKISSGGKTLYNGRLLLSSVANGSYCGGGIKSNPLADVKSGRININIVKNISRASFIKIFPHYKNGTHMNMPGIDKIISNHDCESLSIEPLDGVMKLCVDGEIYEAGKTEFEICPKSFRMIIPR